MARKRLSPGSLRHRVTLESATLTADDSGGSTESWSGTQVWAHIRPASSREVFAQGQVQGQITHVCTLRWFDGIRAASRITWGDRVFQVTGVRTEDEERRVTLIDCVEELT